MGSRGDIRHYKKEGGGPFEEDKINIKLIKKNT